MSCTSTDVSEVPHADLEGLVCNETWEIAPGSMYPAHPMASQIAGGMSQKGGSARVAGPHSRITATAARSFLHIRALMKCVVPKHTSWTWSARHWGV